MTMTEEDKLQFKKWLEKDGNKERLQKLIAKAFQEKAKS
jgi:hypothetical protein